MPSDIPSTSEGEDIYNTASIKGLKADPDCAGRPGYDGSDAIMDRIDKELNTMTRLQVGTDT